MSAIRTSRATPSERACLQCQRRKTKCLPGSGDSCSYCTKAGKTCVFSEKQSRTPLTRRNLDAAEERLRQLEAALQQAGSSVPPETSRPPEPVGDYKETVEAEVATADRSSKPTEEAATPYEWNESLSGNGVHSASRARKAPDGMALFSEGGEAAGYLGNSSGYSMLQSIPHLLPDHSRAHSSERGGNETNNPVPRINLPPLVSRESNGLSATMMQQHLIDAYFLYYNACYPILHERTFMDKVAVRSKIPRENSWHLVYFMVLAIGEWVLGYCSDEHSLYYDAARSRFDIRHLESGNAHSVQAFLLMGNYLQKVDRPNTGYNFLGIAYRMALGLGLHREPGGSGDQNSLAIHRRRVLFWCLYCFDTGFSITTGRPILVSNSFIDIQFPLNIDDSQCDTKSPMPPEVSYPTAYSLLIAQARLARIASKIHAQFMSASPSSEVDQQTSIMEQMISNWRASLPSYFWVADVPDWFDLGRQLVLWKQANLRMLLLLASQKHHTDVHDRVLSGRRYRVVACETIEHISAFCQRSPNMNNGLSWYAVYFLLQACLALSVHQASYASVVHLAQAERDEDLRTYEQLSSLAEECLATLSPSNKAATRSLRVLSRLRQTVRHSSTSPQSRDEGPRSAQASHLNTPANNAAINPPANVPMMPAQPMGAAFANEVNGGNGALVTPGLDNVTLSDWGIAADPSFHMFFNNSDNINHLFQDVGGFPGTLEHDDFAYQSYTM